MAPRRSTSSSKTSGYPSYLAVPPRFGTLRNFERPTYGERQGRIARLLGKPFMPWQQYTADVFGEVDPRTGLRIYRRAIITLMRQQGKTTFVISAKAHRALDCNEPQTMQFAAQDGVEAKKKWLAHAKLFNASPLGRRIPEGQPVTTNGKEVLTWANGSEEWPISSKPSAGHGDTLDLGLVTEAFSQHDNRYEELMRPAMLARPGAQLIIESTAGTAESLYWNETVELERQRMIEEPDAPSRTAFIDYSFAEDDDPGSPETWRRRIPALGITIREEEIQDEWDSAQGSPTKLRNFMRGIGNITDRGAGESTSPFPADDWADTASDEWVIPAERAFALDVTNDRSWATIAQSGHNELGDVQVEVVAHDRSTHWVISRLVELFKENPAAPRRIYIVGGGQASLMVDDIEKKDIEVIVLSRADYAAACARLFDEITAHQLTHRETEQTPLDIAVGGAAWSTGDARVWSRTKSTTIISPLVAVTAARWGYELEGETYDALANIF